MSEFPASKVCTKCKIEKKRADFYVRSRSFDGLTARCKVCRDQENIEWREKNVERVQEWRRQYHAKTISRHLENNIRWRKANPEKYKASIRQWRVKNKEHVQEVNKEWYRNNYPRVAVVAQIWREANIDRVRETRRKATARIRSTLDGKLRNTISARLGKALRGKGVDRKWELLFGYTVQDLKTHLELLFLPGMSWENYGSAWEIDHRISISRFAFQAIDDPAIKSCWALTNLQPLWKLENRLKNNKLEPDLAEAIYG